VAKDHNLDFGVRQFVRRASELPGHATQGYARRARTSQEKEGDPTNPLLAGTIGGLRAFAQRYAPFSSPKSIDALTRLGRSEGAVFTFGDANPRRDVVSDLLAGTILLSLDGCSSGAEGEGDGTWSSYRRSLRASRKRRSRKRRRSRSGAMARRRIPAETTGRGVTPSFPFRASPGDCSDVLPTGPGSNSGCRIRRPCLLAHVRAARDGAPRV